MTKAICACERGGNCTKTSVCAIDAATEELQDELIKVNKSMQAKLARVQDGLQRFIDGDYPQPVDYRPNRCPHGKFLYDACKPCNNDFIADLLKELLE